MSDLPVTQNPVVRERLLEGLASVLVRILEQHATGITADELLQLVSREEAQPLEYVAMALSRVDYMEQADGLILSVPRTGASPVSDLAEFLLARIHDDESVARAAEGCAVPTGTWGATMLAHTLRHDSARILAECRAKRLIVEAAERRSVRVASLDYASLCLALPYADHPDYNPEWRFDGESA